MLRSNFTDDSSPADNLESDSTPDDRLGSRAAENSPTKDSASHLRNHTKVVSTETKKSLKSSHSKKSFIKPDSSLLNFHFERPTQTSSYQSSSNVARNYTPSERRNKARVSMLSKESFLQAK
jgi:hypothetical protein